LEDAIVAVAPAAGAAPEMVPTFVTELALLEPENP
jgi:hypothetical protein